LGGWHRSFDVRVEPRSGLAGGLAQEMRRAPDPDPRREDALGAAVREAIGWPYRFLSDGPDLASRVLGELWDFKEDGPPGTVRAFCAVMAMATDALRSARAALLIHELGGLFAILRRADELQTSPCRLVSVKARHPAGFAADLSGSATFGNASNAMIRNSPLRCGRSTTSSATRFTAGLKASPYMRTGGVNSTGRPTRRMSAPFASARPMPRR
jgi:hypothetical protein